MNLLFVCTGNTCRSPMAAALMNQIAMEKNLDIRIESAGIYAMEGEPATDGAVLAMREHGIDLSSHRAKQLTEKLIRQSDLILTMTESQKMALSGLANCDTLCHYVGIDGEITDPYGGNAEVYRMCAEMLLVLVTRLAERMETSV